MLVGIDASRANRANKTGVEWYSYHLIEQFKKLDAVNRFFLYTDKKLSPPLAAGPVNFIEKKLAWPLPKLWTLGRLSLEMKFGREVPDCLFVGSHTIPLLCPRRTVVTVHDIGFEHFPRLYKWPDKLYHKFTVRFIKRFAKRIICPSEFTKNDLVRQYGLSPEKISVVPNGYDTAKYQYVPEARAVVRERFGLSYPYLLFVGRLEEKKNTARLIEAFAEFRRRYPADERRLVLVGKPAYGYERVKGLIEKFGLRERVIELGWVGDEWLPALHSAADLFVFPSLFEGFGIPVIEAMACRAPVICSNTTSLPEVAGEAALMFSPENVAELVTRMEQVLFNAEVAESLRVKGERRAKEFSWEKCARETLAIILASD